MTRPDAVLREQAFHRTEIPPVQDLAIVRGLSALVVERGAEIEARDELIEAVKADLKGARRPAWQQKRDALDRIRAWEAESA